MTFPLSLQFFGLILVGPLWVCAPFLTYQLALCQILTLTSTLGRETWLFLATILSPRSPAMYCLSDEIVVSRAQGHLRCWFFVFIIAMWVRNHSLGTPPTEGGPGQNSRRLSAVAADPRHGYPYTGVTVLLSIGDLSSALSRAPSRGAPRGSTSTRQNWLL